MTILERIKSITKSHVNLEEDSLEKLVYLAYYIGREEAAKEAHDKYNKLIAEQRKRAADSRYHKFADSIIGEKNQIHSTDYAQEMTALFGSDQTAF